jgi:hypothetical protein
VVTVQTSVIINKPVAEVFSFAANLDNFPAWVEGPAPKKLSPEPFGEGTLFEHPNRPFRTVVVRVVNYRVNRGFQTRSLKAPLSITIEGELEFEDAPLGTRFTLSHRLTIPWWLRLFEPLIARQAQKGNDEAVQALKKAVEGRG